MVKVGLLVRLEAKPGREQEVERFIRSGADLVEIGARDNRMVRRPPGPLDVRHLRRVPGRVGSSRAPRGPRRRRAR